MRYILSVWFILVEFFLNLCLYLHRLVVSDPEMGEFLYAAE